MAKRSPWAAQNRAKINELRKDFSNQPVTSNARKVLRIAMANGSVTNVPVSAKKEFLLANLPLAVKGVRAYIGTSQGRRQTTEATLKSIIEENNSGLIDDFFAHTVNYVTSHELSHQAKRAPGQLRKYLEARGIPLDKRVFEQVLKEFVRDRENYSGTRGLRVRFFEREYLAKAKKSRAEQQLESRLTNRAVQAVLRQNRLTANQKGVVTRRAQREFNQFIQKLYGQANFHEMPVEEVEQQIEIESRRIHELIQRKVLPNFSGKKRKVTTRRKTEAPVRKPGSREERIANHALEVAKREEAKEQRLRRGQVGVKEQAAEVSRKPFDVGTYCLAEISKRNAGEGVQFRALLKSRSLSPYSLKALFIGGPLTQKVFLDAINKHGFIERFGAQQVNALARGVSYMRSTGAKIDRVLNEFRSKQSGKIFRFLVKARLIDPSHGGGKEVYLVKVKGKF
jgi:hypothetical protein